MIVIVVMLLFASSAWAGPAAPATIAANSVFPTGLSASDRQDFEDAAHGLVAAATDLEIKAADGHVVWSLKDYGFLSSAPPAEANPSLWRQAQLNLNAGLYEIAPRIYQLRGFDISDMTIVEGDTGLIVIDPLISIETARAALEFYFAHRDRRPVVAVIYTHSHIDHFGGVRGVADEADVKAGKLHIFAPEGFMAAAVSENVLAGNAMTRRSVYMYGPMLPRGPRGQIDVGLGKAISLGTPSLIAPTDLIRSTGETHKIDGVDFIFQMARGTEAPAEMMFYLPAQRVFDAAEVISHTMHNLYTLRGAEIRDAREWWKAIDEAIARFGDRTDVMIGQHHWPVFGRDRVVELMKKQRDLYKFILDQSLHALNSGLTPNEISASLHLPETLADTFADRGYYGTLSHNAKAVYQKYLGWYDGDPADLDPLPPAEAGRRYVEYMGGSAEILKRARLSYDKGDYRWVVQVLKHVIFAEPGNQEARRLSADAMEQLGYQAESGAWRNEYLVGAHELRDGITKVEGFGAPNVDLIHAVPLDMIFDLMGARLNAAKAADRHLVVNFNFTDIDQQFALNLENSALTYRAGYQAPDADVTVTMTRALFDKAALSPASLIWPIVKGDVIFKGSMLKFAELFTLLDDFPRGFPIVSP